MDHDAVRLAVLAVRFFFLIINPTTTRRITVATEPIPIVQLIGTDVLYFIVLTTYVESEHVLFIFYYFFPTFQEEGPSSKLY